MNSSSAMTKSPPAQRLTSPRSAACAPPLIAPMIEVVLKPPIADTNVSRPSAHCISRTTTKKKKKQNQNQQTAVDHTKEQKETQAPHRRHERQPAERALHFA